MTFYYQINVFSDLSNVIISCMYICALRVGNKVVNGVLHAAVHRLYQVFLLSKCHTVACYMCKCNFIYAHKKSTAFPLMIVMKFTYTEHHCLSISYTKFHPNWTFNVRSMDRYSFTHLSMAFTALTATKLVISRSLWTCSILILIQIG